MAFEHIDIDIKELENNHHLLLISDGSGKAKSRTFKWMLNTPGEHRQVQAAGHCQGRESSLRAEAKGMLSAIVFMTLVQQSRN